MNETVSFEFAELLNRAGHVFDEQLLPFFEPSESLSFQITTNPIAQSNTDLLVYISPKPGATPPPQWLEVMQQYNVSWVGAQNSGNDIHVARRVGLALLAPFVFEKQDHQRIILSGFSGGGRVASMMVVAYPQLYHGALFICGANPMMIAAEESVENLQDKPLVFLTGTGDFNLEDTKMAISTYQQAGLTNTHLTIVQGLDHGLPEAKDLDDVLQTLTKD